MSFVFPYLLSSLDSPLMEKFILVFIIASILLLSERGNCILTRNELVESYFHRGYEYWAIICFLYFLHGIKLSLRQLKRILKMLNLRRRPCHNRAYQVLLRRRVRVDLAALMHIGPPYVSESHFLRVQEELMDTGSLLGYRSLWKRISLKYKIPVAR